MIHVNNYPGAGTAGNAGVSVLAVGGFDPSGGAGVLLDSAAVRAVGVHCAAVCTMLTRQNGVNFDGTMDVPVAEIIDTIRLVTTVMPIRSIKIGALGRAETASAIGAAADRLGVPLVVDPVLRSSSGGVLADGGATDVLRRELVPRAFLLTPNLLEASLLCGRPVDTVARMEEAARSLVCAGARHVLVKGGHLPGNELVDVLAGPDGQMRHYRGPRLGVGDVRGTGCALASLCAAFIGLGESVENAVETARDRLAAAIAGARSFDGGPPLLRFD